MIVYKAMSHVILHRMREFYPAPTLVAQNKRGIFSEQPPYIEGTICVHVKVLSAWEQTSPKLPDLDSFTELGGKVLDSSLTDAVI
jgi:hypothetical protein